MKNILIGLFCVVVISGCASYGHYSPHGVVGNFVSSSSSWPSTFPHVEGDVHLAKVKVIEGFDIPESLAVDYKNNCLYVPSCAGDSEKTWVDDADGYISKLSRDGSKVLKKKWLKSKPGAVLNDPKALSIFDGYLYVCDNKRLLKVGLGWRRTVKEIKLDNTDGLADSVVFKDHLYVGNGADKIIYKISKKGEITKIKGVDNINGMAVYGDKMYTVTWGTHEIFEIDPDGKKDPVSFGLADKFVNLDGLAILPDGTFLISDFMGKAIYGLSPDRKKLRKLALVDSPADIVIDHEKLLLYVPSYFGKKLSIYSVDWKK